MGRAVLEWFTWVQLAVAIVGGMLATILGLLGRRPSDLTMAFAGVTSLLLLVQLGVTIASPLMGNEPTGSLLEFYMYLVTALIIPLAAGFWALIDRTRWSTVVVGVALIAVAIMLARMNVIWFVQ
ncbi:MAG: hypothetical protein ACOYKK_06345 [Microbacteriaceae bacterium]